MSTSPPPTTAQAAPQEAAALLQRILAAVEKDQQRRWFELACAILLSLTTMASAWCAYQSTLWNGVQTFRLAEAGRAGRENAKATFTAVLSRAFDASMLISYMQAKFEGNTRQERFLENRFRPEMKVALEAWWKSDPLNNPMSPLTPFHMAEYTQKEVVAARRLDDVAAEEHAAAHEANAAADGYVLLTVLFASVLFFGGIAGMMNSTRLRYTIMSVALALFVITMMFLIRMPICNS